MIYECLEDVRHRSNFLGVILNEATKYGRQPLPAEFEPIAREHRALSDIYMNPALLKDKPSIPYFDEDKS